MNTATKQASHYHLIIGRSTGWNYDSLNEAMFEKEQNERDGIRCGLWVVFTDGTMERL